MTCENSQTNPCPNKGYRSIWVFDFGTMLCRKHYTAIRSWAVSKGYWA